MSARGTYVPLGPDPEYRCETLVLGIGNILWADEGFGVRAVESLHRGWRFGSDTRLMDGGTQGLYLLPHVEGARQILICDAVDYGLPPGTLKCVQDREVPAFMGAKKLSLHQTGFQEVLSVAGFRGWQPDHLALIGVQPEVLEDYGGSLSDTVRSRLPETLELALGLLQAWGARPRARLLPPKPTERITLDALEMTPYESERPSARSACRVGDGRFLHLGSDA